MNISGSVGVIQGDVVGGNKGLTTEEVVPRLDVLAEVQQAILAAVQADKGVPLEVLRQILSGFGEAEVMPEPAQIEQRLRAKAEEYHALLRRLARLSSDDPDVGRLRREAGGLIEAGDFATADAVLAGAENLDLEAVEELEASAERRRLRAPNETGFGALWGAWRSCLSPTICGP